MSVDTDPGGTHILNTIQIDGEWYIIDVTFDDPDQSDPTVARYWRFNIGLDRNSSYEWKAVEQWYPIAETSNPAYLIKK